MAKLTKIALKNVSFTAAKKLQVKTNACKNLGEKKERVELRSLESPHTQFWGKKVYRILKLTTHGWNAINPATHTHKCL